jgi:8-oxo-dGTP pyrophosphatase MutT (NUDIX family)
LARSDAIVAALKAVPGGRYAAPNTGMGRVAPVTAEMLYPNPYSTANNAASYLPRPPGVFTDGAFSPMSPIQPTPVDEPPFPGGMPGPRWWQYRVGWNLPTPPGTEGLKLTSFENLKILSEKYSIARSCIDIRIEEIRSLEWDITLTTDAAKAYQGDRNMMRDFGERKAQAKRFFRHPDPDFWNFDSFLNAFLEEIFVYDALSLVFRPKFGSVFGRGGRGLLGSDLDSLNLVAGMTMRPLVDIHGGIPRPPAPAYQQFLYGVPRSDYMTIATGADIDQGGLAGAEVNEFSSDIMLYAPYWRRRETPYGFPPVERALLPIISGLQKQEFQLDYFTEGTIPAVYISPGDPNITPTQIGELQNALNALAGDPAYHLKVVVLPPGSKVEPQRPVDLSDSFDFLVMNQVAMAFDIQPTELGIIPNIGSTPSGPGASSVRFAGQEKRDIKSRVSAKPLLKWICDIFNYVLQDICKQPDMQFQFEGLVDDEDKQAITELGVQQVQNGIASIDEIRERLDLPPWGLPETSEPVLFTATGALPLGMSTELIQSTIQSNNTAGQGTNSGQSKPAKKPNIRRGGQTTPNGNHPAPVAPHREPVGMTGTPQHAAAAGAIQSPTPRTGGSAARNPVAGSRKKNPTPSPRTISGKAVTAELQALTRHLRKGREITTWNPVNIDDRVLGMIAEDLAKGVMLDVAVSRAESFALKDDATDQRREFTEDEPLANAISGDDSDDMGVDDDKDDDDDGGEKIAVPDALKDREFPGWEHDLELVSAYKEKIREAFDDAGSRSTDLKKKAASGLMYVPATVLHGLLGDTVREVFTDMMNTMWTHAWNLGYEGAKSLVTGREPDFECKHEGDHLQGFLGTEGVHWLDQIVRTGLGGSQARAEVIARTEVARALNAGALQAYRDAGVQHKHLLVAPGDLDEVCKNAAAQGAIPLDAIFPGGNPPFHPQCFCMAAPVDINTISPHIHHADKFVQEDESRVAWLLIRAKDEDGKYRYLLQQHDDGSWGMPGGSTHVGESGWAAAVREATEELGELPELSVRALLHHVDPDGVRVYLYLCECSFFRPKLNGSTPEETRGTGWFRQKEVKDLDLTPKFRDDWDHIIHDALAGLKEEHPKYLQVDENGERLDVVTNPVQNPQGGGGRWNYPHRGDATEVPGPGVMPFPVNRRPGGGQNAGEMGAAEPPGWEGESETFTDAPANVNDGDYPRRRIRNRPASRFPGQGSELQDKYPAGGNSKQPPGQSVGAVTGVPPSGVTKGAADFNDPNPVEAEHVYLQLAKNFPPDAIAWVKHAKWIGPVWIPWDRIDTDSKDSWAASHQPGKVKEFQDAILAHAGHVAPSVLVQEPNSNRAFIVDGHHRAVARENLKQKVLAYVGNIDPKDRQAALETHAKQFHSGSDPENK